MHDVGEAHRLHPEKPRVVYLVEDVERERDNNRARYGKAMQMASQWKNRAEAAEKDKTRLEKDVYSLQHAVWDEVDARKAAEKKLIEIEEQGLSAMGLLRLRKAEARVKELEAMLKEDKRSTEKLKKG